MREHVLDAAEQMLDWHSAFDVHADAAPPQMPDDEQEMPFPQSVDESAMHVDPSGFAAAGALHVLLGSHVPDSQ